MLARSLDRLGDRYPQLFRELKGRLRWRGVSLAIAGSLLFQIVVMFSYWTRLPFDEKKYEYIGTRYCEPADPYGCILDSAGQPIVLWDLWWSDICEVLSGFSITLLIGGGIFLLVSDLVNEQRRGTLNFLRLSPQSGHSIFFGKLLGVPILVYLAVVAIAPLNLWTALQANFPISYPISFYLLLASLGFCFYGVAMLYPMLGGRQVLVGLGLSGAAVVGSCNVVRELFFPMAGFEQGGPPDLERTSEVWRWWHISLLKSPTQLHGLAIATCLAVGYWMWQMWVRRYQHADDTTPLSKGQSYALNLGVQFYLLGFIMPHLSEVLRGDIHVVSFTLFWMGMSELGFVLLLTLAIAPTRQPLQDWAGYRHLLRQDEPSQTRRSRRQRAIRDLLWGEKSPAVLAMAINVAIVMAKWLLWNVYEQNWLEHLLIWAIAVTLLLFYSAIVQRLLVLQTSKRYFVALGSVFTLIALPPLLILVAISPMLGGQLTWLWTVMTFGVSFVQDELSAVPLALAWAVDLGAAIAVIHNFHHTLWRLGASGWQRILGARPTRLSGSQF